MNLLYYGDNLDVLREHIADNSIDCVYLDPPFQSQRNYNVLFANRSGEDAQAQIEAFEDTWIWSQQSEAAYDDVTRGGRATAEVVDAMQAMRKLLGPSDALAYLVMMAQRLIEVTIAELLAGKVLPLPPAIRPYMQAQPSRRPQQALFD